MAEQREAVLRIIFKALASLNEERGSDGQIPVNLDTPLFGSSSMLDSLSLVSVIVDVETDVSEAFGCFVSLTDDRALSSAVSPFSSVAAMADYTIELLRQERTRP